MFVVCLMGFERGAHQTWPISPAGFSSGSNEINLEHQQWVVESRQIQPGVS